jgi:hypothetical protein
LVHNRHGDEHEVFAQRLAGPLRDVDPPPGHREGAVELRPLGGSEVRAHLSLARAVGQEAAGAVDYHEPGAGDGPGGAVEELPDDGHRRRRGRRVGSHQRDVVVDPGRGQHGVVLECRFELTRRSPGQVDGQWNLQRHHDHGEQVDGRQE